MHIILLSCCHNFSFSMVTSCCVIIIFHFCVLISHVTFCLAIPIIMLITSKYMQVPKPLKLPAHITVFSLHFLGSHPCTSLFANAAHPAVCLLHSCPWGLLVIPTFPSVFPALDSLSQGLSSC